MIKNEIFKIVNNSISKICFDTFLVDPKILRVVKYVCLLFNIILIINITQLLLYDGKKSVKLKI